MVVAILFSGILQGLLLVVLLYQKGFNKIPNRILAALVFLIACHLTLIVIDVKDLFIKLPHLSRLSWLLPLCYGPMILLLTQSILQKNFSLRKNHFLYFLPFAIYLIILTPYYLQSATEKIMYLSDQGKVSQADFGWMNHLTNYFHIGFLVTALIWRKIHKPEFATPEVRLTNSPLPWLGKFLWAVLIILIFSLLTFYAKKFDIKYLSEVYPNHFLLVVVFVYWLAYRLLQQKTAFENHEINRLTEVADIQPKYQKTGLDFRASKSLAVDLEYYMKTEKPYLDPTLTITDLGNQLSLSKHQISQVINAEFEVNFYEFINHYRIAEFKKQSQNPKNDHLSLLGIAFEAGFNSKATFNQVFKKKEGITPSDFLKQQKMEEISLPHSSYDFHK